MSSRQLESSAPSAQEEVPRLHVPIVRFRLSCGAVLLVSPRPGAPVTAVQVHLRGSEALDPRGKEGTAFLTGALLDQGTRSKTDEEIAELLETAGGSIAGGASSVSANIAGRDTNLLLELLSELLVEPSYPQRQFERQRQRVLDRLLVERDDPRVQGEHLFRKLVYGTHWLGRPSAGTIASLGRLTRADLVAFHREAWVASRAVLAVCGDVEPERVRALLERRLARWKSGVDLVTTPPVFPPLGTRAKTFPAERAQVHVHLGHLGIRRNDPDYATLVVLDHVLGTGPGFTNRISKKLRDELGLAYTVNAAIHASAGILPGTFSAYIGTSPRHVATALEGFRAEIRRVQEELVGADELRVAQDYLVGSFVLSFQRASRRAGYLISAERHNLPEDNLVSLPRQFENVTLEDLRRVARAHLHPDACCVVAAGPISQQELEKALKGPRAKSPPSSRKR
ncbi:MAG TPA: pitrilysin family protein [Planctomycetota bacterium]|nr:pitrilysin family protein [Planctomycetota bacterium]